MNTATRTTRKKNSKNGNGNGIRKPSRKTPMPVRPEGETIEQQQQPDNKRKREITMSEPENMQTASEGIQMQEPQTGNKRGRMQEGDVSLSSSPLMQQQKVEDPANMSLSLPGEEEVQDSANMSPPPQQQEVQKMQDSAANAPLSPSGEEPGLGAVTPPPLKEMQDSANDVSLSPSGEEPGLGALPPLEEVQDSAANAPLLPSGEESPLLKVQNSENVSPPPPSLQEGQNSENVFLSSPSLESGAVEAQVPGAPPPPLAPEMSGQEQVKPVVAEEQKEKDPVRDALVKQLEEIKQQTKVIEDALNETNSAAGGGMMKKRKKTFYKRYKSKKSMKRRNKTSRNN
jgi:hypothetical protein